MREQTAYTELIARAREAALVSSCAALLAWDQDTYMPPGGVAHRANQMALLAGLEHDRAASPQLAELLDTVEGSALVADPLSPAAVNVRELRRTWERARRLPRALVEEIAHVTAVAEQEWALARSAADYGRFRPWLERIITLKRQEAECRGYQDVPYDALLDEHEPGMTTAEVALLFDGLRRELVPLAAEIASARRPPRHDLPGRDFPVDRQRLLAESVAATLGFDFQGGRLDTSVHPYFIRIGPGDCRITSRFTADDFRPGLFTVLHEVGHALYEQGLDPAYHGTPMGEAASVGVHESQARLWENTVGRRLSFWQFFLPLVRRVFPQTLDDVSLEDFHRAINTVAPTLIRVGADEVTYNLHIIVRFELERALLAGDLAAADLPAAWNEAYRRNLGVVPANDGEGCLQDGHWAAGQLGYFPTYTLGNLYAAQLFAAADAERSGLDEAFAHGDFAGLLDWLRQRVHRHGQRYRAPRLIEQATGRPPSPGPFLRGLAEKYRPLYGL